MPDINADEQELAKFSELAHRWWDKTSEFKPLHEINPLRLDWINRSVALPGKRVLDVGCGGGILAESMAHLGATVSGIDLSEKALSVARLHLFESRLTVDYQKSAVEDFALARPESFDVVTCMEMLEHVPDPASVVKACAALLKPGGSLFLSTLNRQLKSYLLAVVGAEYVLNMLPRGTHDYEKFIKPSELARFARDANLQVDELTGMSYDPLSRQYSLGANTDVNYLMKVSKNA
jgi:2-polyprenyl-6-hydroxyphenyl methylase / 3-demethylubiquinone-9 3-methyltransferase